MFTVSEIMAVTEQLENSGLRTLGSFMFKQFGLDWNKDKALREVHDILDKDYDQNRRETQKRLYHD